MRYDIYPAHFPFDLRCQRGILMHINHSMALWFFIPAMYEHSVGWFADDFMWAYNFLNPN